MEKHIIGENGIAYTLGAHGLYYPDLELPEGTHYEIGKYGRMRWAYLKNHRRGEYIRLLMNGKINELSGGQKAKLLLIKLILDKSEVLVLDEPTTNLSPLSNPVIRKALKDFDGCIISISHDRKYIDEVIDDLYILNSDGIKKIEKDYIWQ